MKIILLSLVALAGAAAPKSATLDPVSITWKPEVGKTLNFTSKITAAGGSLGEIQMGSDTAETVKSIQPDGNILIEDKESHLTFVVGGVDQSSNPQVPQSVTETFTEMPNGHVVTRTSDAPEQQPAQVNEISQFIYPDHPVNVNDTWNYVGKGDTAKGINDYRFDYTYLGTDTVNGIASYKVGVVFKETGTKGTPMTGTGTVWVDTTNGTMAKTTMQVKGIDLGPLGQSDMTVEINRKS